MYETRIERCFTFTDPEFVGMRKISGNKSHGWLRMIFCNRWSYSRISHVKRVICWKIWHWWCWLFANWQPTMWHWLLLIYNFENDILINHNQWMCIPFLLRVLEHEKSSRCLLANFHLATIGHCSKIIESKHILRHYIISTEYKIVHDVWPVSLVFILLV